MRIKVAIHPVIQAYMFLMSPIPLHCGSFVCVEEMSSDEKEKNLKILIYHPISAKKYQVNIEYIVLEYLFVLMGRYIHYQSQ